MTLSDVDWLCWIGYRPGAEAGENELGARAQSIVYHYLKTPRVEELMKKVSFGRDRKLQGVGEELMDKFFPEDCLLVPMPGSAQLLGKGNEHWGPREMCRFAVEAGLAPEWEALLERVETIPSSKQCARDERPSAARQFETMRATRDGLQAMNITIVDDVITRGATLVGAAARLRQAFPNAVVRGFAFARTLIGVPVKALPDPLSGYVEIFASGKTFRHPKEEPSAVEVFGDR